MTDIGTIVGPIKGVPLGSANLDETLPNMYIHVHVYACVEEECIYMITKCV